MPSLPFPPLPFRAVPATDGSSVVESLAEVFHRSEAYDDPAVWIHRLAREDLLARARQVEERGPADQPLYGASFAIKDNIDLAGVPTTAGCPEFARVPGQSALVVDRLMTAGAIPAGKANLDQFATGLNGTRSPYGTPRNVFNPAHIPGGSSSGSAVAVAAGLVSFALGTDTAGSGRVPAAFNGIVGLKPTRGRLSARGVVPACRSLDCVSIFTRTCADAGAVLAGAEGFDADDPFSRPVAPATGPFSGIWRLGVPRADQLEWFGQTESPRLFAAALDRLRAVGMQLIEIDFAPFLEAAGLLYGGPWTAERYAAVGEFIAQHQAACDPIVSQIILGGKAPSAVEAFRAMYRLEELRRRAGTELAGVDALVTPTTGAIYTLAEIKADPIGLNSNLGRYTNFMNLLDLCGLAVPAGNYAAGPGFGITFSAPAWHDRRLLALGAQFLGEAIPAAANGVPEGWIELAVCGAHLRGQPLNGQIASLGGHFVAATTTAANYRLYALPRTQPPKPGLARMAAGAPGAPIAVETFALAPAAFGKFVAAIPAPMAIGTVELADGRRVKGFLCEPAALEGAADITAFGGWAAYLADA